MAPIDKELESEIRKGVKLAKPSAAELKAREEEKKKRMAEIEKLKKAVGSKAEEE